LRLWTVPALIALSSLAGLLAGLLADGVWDVVSWLSLGLPVAVIARHLWAR
jgi:hypothetical protein